MMRRLSLAAVGLFLTVLLSTDVAAQKVVRRSLTFEGKTRNYYVLLPEPTPAEPFPLVVLLHGSGRDGTSLTSEWQALAKKQGFALLAPDAIDHAAWDMLSDGPDFLHEVIEAVKSQARVDPRRVYLFGHSAGAHHALGIGLLESKYFAAVAVHAGVLNETTTTYAALADRKIPFALWQGTKDEMVPAPLARTTRDTLRSQGFPADLTEMVGHTHNYYGRSAQINAAVWTFFQKHRLESDPVYRQHRFAR